MTQQRFMYDKFPELDMISLEDNFAELDEQKKIYFSVFFQTIKDIAKGGLSFEDMQILYRWLEEDYTFSLSFICDVLGWDVNFLRKRLTRLL